MIPTDADMQKEKTIHMGRNVKRFREMFNLKQEGLAYELGEGWSQKKVSLLEQKETIEDDVLEEIAKALKIPAEAIRNFDEEKAIYNIQNNYDNATQNINFQFNPIEKIMELYESKIALYERMLKDRDVMIEELKNLKK
jgi:transcriptional regulator with XRE-family HTH domain